MEKLIKWYSVNLPLHVLDVKGKRSFDLLVIFIYMSFLLKIRYLLIFIIL